MTGGEKIDIESSVFVSGEHPIKVIFQNDLMATV